VAVAALEAQERAEREPERDRDDGADGHPGDVRRRRMGVRAREIGDPDGAQHEREDDQPAAGERFADHLTADHVDEGGSDRQDGHRA